MVKTCHRGCKGLSNKPWLNPYDRPCLLFFVISTVQWYSDVSSIDLNTPVMFAVNVVISYLTTSSYIATLFSSVLYIC